MRAAIILVLAAALAACDALPAGRGAEVGGISADGYRPRELASSERLPERFGFGTAATAEAIARMDVDVMPDGRGLPAGRGTAAQGAPIYAAKCAICHGAEGEGTPLAAALVGSDLEDAFGEGERDGVKTIGNYWPYSTTVFDYVRRAMPFDRPGSLTDEEVYALTAYLLYRNQIIAGDAVMDARTLPQVRMPARDRFVRDDREESTRVR